MSIETKGKEWGQTYFKEQGSNKSELVLVVPKADVWIMDLPNLMGENSGLRLDGLGNIYQQRWKEIGLDKLQAKAEQWQLLYPRSDRVKADYLQQIPKHKQVAKVWQLVKFETVESAIRAQKHILENVTGEDVNSDLGQAEAVIGQISIFSKAILSKPVSDNSLETLGKITEDFLTENRLDSALAFRKVSMATRLRQAFMKDSLDRVNPLVTRTRLRSAYLQAVKQQVMASRVAEKYTTNQVQLEYERELNRWAVREADEMLEMKLLWHAGFVKNTYESMSQKNVLEQITKEIAYQVLTVPRIRPYLSVARLAGLALVGCKPDKVELNQRIIDNQDQWNWLTGSDLSVIQLIQSNDFKTAGLKIEAIRGYLSDILR